jgi:excisionase family DNA binding protein
MSNMMRIGGDEVLTLKEAAEMIGLSPQTLYLQVRRGKLTATKKGREFLVLRSEVERYDREVKGRSGFANPDHPLFGKRGGGGRKRKDAVVPPPGRRSGDDTC